MNKQQQLDEIKADIVKNNICPELTKGATQLVFGDGNPDADIVFIGEAPGKKEDEQGLPFVGASGHFLSDMLQLINLKREQIYITNIVKYRPPNNRDPLEEEKAAFLPYLERQLGVIKPLLIVTLGRHSTNCFLPGVQIGQVHGQPKRIKFGEWGMVGGRWGKDKTASTTNYKTLSPGKIVILPLYHPAAALYNGSMRTTLTEDFLKIPIILQLIRQEK